MSGSANISSMQRAIIKYIESRIPKDQNQAHIGRVVNGHITINNASYPCVPAVDMYFGEGSRVACILPEKANKAIVVGVI